MEEALEKIIIEGGSNLYGDVYIGGMKNSALPILFATMLVKDDCIIDGVPRVSDIFNTLKILNDMGADAYFVDENTVFVNASNATNIIKNQALISKMRASSYLMGASLARFGGITINMPGGCNFGVRPIEQHLKGFERLGASCSQNEGIIEISTKKSLKNEKITLDKISVGATINIVLASIFIDGLTVIDNCAMEPHVDDLICFLNKCGAKIIRNGRRIFVCGVKQLHGARHRIYPDMIEALTYMTFLGTAGGQISLHNCIFDHLTYTVDALTEMGLEIFDYGSSITVKRKGNIKGISVETAPYPFLPTDIHPQLCALLCFAKNEGKIREGVFPTRFAYVNELKKMGANIFVQGDTVTVKPSNLHSAQLDATDLRAGAALITASLGVDGTCEIKNVNYIVRGYELLSEKLSSIGGKIRIIKEN